MSKRPNPTCEITMEAMIKAITPGNDDGPGPSMWVTADVRGVCFDRDNGADPKAAQAFRVRFSPRTTANLTTQGGIKIGTIVRLSGALRFAPGELVIYAESAAVLDRSQERKGDRPDRVDAKTPIPYAEEVRLAL